MSWVTFTLVLIWSAAPTFLNIRASHALYDSKAQFLLTSTPRFFMSSMNKLSTIPWCTSRMYGSNTSMTGG